MRTLHDERQAKYRLSLIATFPNIFEVTDPFVWGSHCWTFTGKHERWIPAHAVLSIGFGVQTAPEVARDYLTVKYARRRKRAFKEQAQAFDEMPAMPLLIRPGRYSDHVYVDMRAAYLSIMDLVGWDVDYNPGQWIIPGRPPDDFPLRKDKIARNTLVTAGLPLSLRVWTGKTFVTRGGPNPLINKGLWLIIADTLHMIAGLAFELRAVYVNCDGAILPRESVSSYRAALWDLGFDTTIRAEGDTNLRSFGNFRLGTWHTKLYDPLKPVQRDDSNLRQVDREYLIKTLYRIHKYRSDVR